MDLKEVFQNEFVKSDASKGIMRLACLGQMAKKYHALTGRQIFLEEAIRGIYLGGKAAIDVAPKLGVGSEDVELWAETAAYLWPIKGFEYSGEAKGLGDDIRLVVSERFIEKSISAESAEEEKPIKEQVFLSGYLEGGWRVLALSHIGSSQEGYFLIEDPREIIHGYIEKSNEQEATEQNIDAFLDALAKKDLYKTERFGNGFLCFVRDPKEVEIMGGEEEITITPALEIAQPRMILDSLRSWLEERKSTIEAKVKNLGSEIELVKQRLETLESEYASSQTAKSKWEEAFAKFQEFLEILPRE